MKKTFKLKEPGKHDQRVVEAIKNDVRKYVKRERRKALPAGVDFWDFNCKFAPDKAVAEIKHLSEIAPAIDQAAKNGCAEVYVEILATPGHRTKRQPGPLLENQSDVLDPGISSQGSLE